MFGFQQAQAAHLQETQQRQAVVLTQRDIEAALVEKMKASDACDISSFFFVPSPLTPLYINPEDVEIDANGVYRMKAGKQIPEGLIPAAKMNSVNTVLARVFTLNAMLNARIPVTIFCAAENRAKADGLPGFVDDAQIQRLKRRYGKLLDIRVISDELFKRHQDEMPAATYFENGQFKAVYSQQIADQANLSRPWGIDASNDRFFPILKSLCRHTQVDCPLETAVTRTYHHSLTNRDYWEERSLWKTLIHVSKQSMSNSDAYHPQILANLCAAAFYLGRYSEAEHDGNRGLALPETLVHAETHCRLLYLKSAAVRSLNRYAEAADLCKQALSLYQEKNLTDKRLLAKIYFNLLAAEMDNPNSTCQLQAIETLAESSITLLNQCDLEEEASRVHIRMANYYLKSSLLDKAQSSLLSVAITVKIDTSRVTAHYELAKGRFMVASNRPEDAEISFKRSMEIAQDLGAEKDYERAQGEFNQLKNSVSSTVSATKSTPY